MQKPTAVLTVPMTGLNIPGEWSRSLLVVWNSLEYPPVENVGERPEKTKVFAKRGILSSQDRRN